MSLDLSAKAEYAVSIDDRLLAKVQKKKNETVDLFTVRYSFRPDSLSSTTPLFVTKAKDEYILKGSGEDSHVFRGQGQATKDVECVLVFDPATSGFELKPLDFTLRVNPSREKPSSSNSTTNRPPPFATDSSRSPSVSSESHSRSISPMPKGGQTTLKLETVKSEVVKPLTSATRKQVASKKLPSTRVAERSVPGTQTAKKSTVKASSKEIVHNDSDVDEDLLGALANELEESLEDDSNDPKKPVVVSGSEESDVDDDYQGIQVIESNKPPARRPESAVNSAFPSPAVGSGGPISLRGFVDSTRPDEEDLSSSEEE